MSVSGPQRPLILLTGASGYIGGRLLHALGGHAGWYLGDQLWELRGALDVLVGGPGLAARPP